MESSSSFGTSSCGLDTVGVFVGDTIKDCVVDV